MLAHVKYNDLITKDKKSKLLFYIEFINNQEKSLFKI